MNGFFAISIPFALLLLPTHPLRAESPARTPPDPRLQDELESYVLKKVNRSRDPDFSLAALSEDGEYRKRVKKSGLRLLGGPMLGCVTYRSARFRIRTLVPATAQAVVSADPDLANPLKSKSVETQVDGDLTAMLDVKGLEPFTTYTYDILIDGVSALKPELPSFRTYPTKMQRVKFDVGFGGGARYKPKRERIWDTIASYHPLAFLFLGDNVYIDKPKQRNKQRIHYYRRQLRPEFRRLCSTTSVYAIWDDHDFGKNNSAGGPDPFQPAWKVPVWRVFRENWNNPYYGGGEKNPGVWFDFSIGDVDFFMTDGRYYRSSRNGTQFGPVQKRWLLEGLKRSTASFKVIATGTPWTNNANDGRTVSFRGFEGEREEILSLLDRERIGGVIFISADRHRSDVYRIERPGGYDIYEFESSKLTNSHSHWRKREALFSTNRGNFFGLLTFDFTKADPEVTFRCITADRKTLYTLTLKKRQLQSNR